MFFEICIIHYGNKKCQQSRIWAKITFFYWYNIAFALFSFNHFESCFLQTCDFQKVYSNSALRVTYEGVMRLMSCSRSCCRRWYITINGIECSTPAPIDALIYANGVSGLNLHRPGTLDGFCNNIPAGRVTVGLSVGKCSGYPDLGDAYTCWNSVCRFIIEEVPLMQ